MVFPKPTPDSILRVLVIDDEKNIRATLSLCLEQSRLSGDRGIVRRKRALTRSPNTPTIWRFSTSVSATPAVSTSSPN